MSNNKLSIIIPIYNSEKYLEKCINSVLEQTFFDFQLILVNDASTDKSGEICDRYALLDKRIRVIHHEKNRGLSLAREDGLLLAESEWVSFMDNDDYVHPEMYERLMRNAEKGDIICARGEDKSSKEIDNIYWDNEEKELLRFFGKEASNIIYSQVMDLGCIGPIWGKIIKKSLIDFVREKVEPYREKLYWVFFEDVLFTPFMFYYANTVVIDNRLMYLHRHFKDNLSSTLIPKEYHYEAVEAGDIVLQLFCESNLYEAYNKYLQGYFLLVVSTWYKVWKNETDDERRRTFEIKVDDIYNSYYSDFVKFKRQRISDNIIKGVIKCFGKNKVLWGKTIGSLYFGIIRKILY